MLRLFREANKASATKLEVVASRPLWGPWRLVPIDSDSEVEASGVVFMMVVFCGMPAAGVIADAVIKQFCTGAYT
mgnify:CR=1 FL=1